MLGKRFYLFYVTKTDMYNKSYRETMFYLLYITKDNDIKHSHQLLMEGKAGRREVRWKVKIGRVEENGVGHGG